MPKSIGMLHLNRSTLFFFNVSYLFEVVMTGKAVVDHAVI